MNAEPCKSAEDNVSRLLYTARGQRVILDTDLAQLYGATTRRLNEQYRRNLPRFPEDFAFRLTRDEWQRFKSQVRNGSGNRSQIATGSQKHRDPRFPPIAFMEHGALMAANMLNSPRAVSMSVYVKCAQ